MQRPDAYEFDDDPTRIDLDAVWAYLGTDAYWGRWRDRNHVQQQIGSAWRVVACYESGGSLVGFARAMSDGVAVAYLADVYVLDSHRGRGLGTELVRVMVEAGPGREFRWLLHTDDAHGLYRKFGFAPPDRTFLERPSHR